MEFEWVGAFTARCGDSLLFVEEGRGGSQTTSSGLAFVT